MAETPNPYIAGNPLTGAEMFFGRQDVFDFVRRALTGQHQDQVLVLYGQRRTGKTSALYQMHRHLGERYLPIFIDLHGLALDGLTGFILELASYIGRGLRRNYQIELPPVDAVELKANPRFYFESTFLDSVWAAIGERHLLLMLDEAIRLEEQVRSGKLEAEVFEYLRHLMQHHPRLNFLFSLGSGLEEMEKEYAFLFNVALYKKISFLDRKSAVDLITQPIRGCFTIDDSAVERILTVTSGHPYYTQLICHGLFNHAQSSALENVSRDDVDAVLDEAVERGLAVLKHVWEESNPAEKAVMAGLAASLPHPESAANEEEILQAWASLELNIPRGAISGAIKNLIARDVIRGDSAYRFTVDLQRRWVLKYRRIEWAKDEILPWAERLPRQADPLITAGAEAPPPSSASRRNRIRNVLISLALPLVFILYTAFYNPGWLIGGKGAGSEPEKPPVSQGGGVVFGGDWLLVNDLLAMGDEVWATTEGGLVRWIPGGSTLMNSGDELGLYDSCVDAIASYDGSEVWLGCGGAVLLSVDGDQLEYQDYYNQDDDLEMPSVRVLLALEDGTVWAGGRSMEASDSSLSHFDGENWHSQDPVNAQIADIAGDTSIITSLLLASDGRLWLGFGEGAHAGIAIWDGEQLQTLGDTFVEQTEDVDLSVRRMVEDQSGDVWFAASDMGLVRLFSGEETINLVPMPDYDGGIYTVAELPDGSLWAGGDNYIAVSDDGGEIWTQVGTGDGLGEEITAIAQAEDGTIFASSYGSGISILEDGAWRTVELTQ